MQKLILASGSPRRRELLSLLVKDFMVVQSGADETIKEPLPPAEYVCALAQRKAQEVAQRYPDAVVIGSDTVVFCDGEILGKPRDAAQAAEMLRRLSGRTHTVATAVAVCGSWGVRVFSSETLVEFAAISAAEIDWYISTGEPMDKAGAYGIQGLASRFIKGIQGDYYTVMGLPVQKLYQVLLELGVL